jgi:hypothetical protein
MDEIGVEHRGYGTNMKKESEYRKLNHSYLIYGSFGVSKSPDFIYRNNNFGTREGKAASVTFLKKIDRYVHLGGTFFFNFNDTVNLYTSDTLLREKDNTFGISATGELCYPVWLFEPFISAAPTVNINNVEIKGPNSTERFGGTAVGAKFAVGVRMYISDFYMVGLSFEKSYNTQSLRRHGSPVSADFNMTGILLLLGAYY